MWWWLDRRERASKSEGLPLALNKIWGWVARWTAESPPAYSRQPWFSNQLQPREFVDIVPEGARLLSFAKG